MKTQPDQLATRNDVFRKSWTDVVFTSNVLTRITHHLELARAVHEYSDFTDDNDPYGEHDFGSLQFEGHTVFWKIDYYDQGLNYWCDPLDEHCRRVMTVMLAEDY